MHTVHTKHYRTSVRWEEGRCHLRAWYFSIVGHFFILSFDVRVFDRADRPTITRKLWIWTVSRDKIYFLRFFRQTLLFPLLLPSSCGRGFVLELWYTFSKINVLAELHCIGIRVCIHSRSIFLTEPSSPEQVDRSQSVAKGRNSELFIYTKVDRQVSILIGLLWKL